MVHRVLRIFSKCTFLGDKKQRPQDTRLMPDCDGTVGQKQEHPMQARDQVRHIFKCSAKPACWRYVLMSFLPFPAKNLVTDALGTTLSRMRDAKVGLRASNPAGKSCP